MTALRGLQESHPEMGAEELQCLNNQVLLMIAEYHLTSTSQGTHRILPVLPEGAARMMPPLDEYLPGSFDGCRDVRVTDRALILRVATWLHCLDLSATYGGRDGLTSCSAGLESLGQSVPGHFSCWVGCSQSEAFPPFSAGNANVQTSMTSQLL